MHVDGKEVAEITVDDVLRILQKDIEIEDTDTDEDLSIVTNHGFGKDNSKQDSLLFEERPAGLPYDDSQASGNNNCFIEIHRFKTNI